MHEDRYTWCFNRTLELYVILCFVAFAGHDTSALKRAGRGDEKKAGLEG